MAQIKIEEPAVSKIRHNEAHIEWITHIKTRGIIEYGETQKLGLKKYINRLRREHLTKLTRLKPGRQYFFRIIAKDRKGQTATSDIYTFKTESFEVTQAPSLKMISLPQASAQSSTKASISWKTNLAANSVVIYGTKHKRYTPYVSSLLTEVHIVLLEDLTPNTRYFYQVKSKDKLNRTVTSTYSSFVTPAPPKENRLPSLKTGPALSRLTAKTIRVEWSTDRACKTYIKWGKVPLPSFQAKKDIQKKFSKFHILEIKNLLPNTRYYYTIYMEDERGAKNNTEIFTFKTPALR